MTLAFPGPKPPKSEDHVYMNSTAIKINFYAWRDGGCPILGFRVSYRIAGSEHWIKVGRIAPLLPINYDVPIILNILNQSIQEIDLFIFSVGIL